MITYETFRQSCLDLSVLGLQDQPQKKYTVPADTKVLAWLNDFAVYFCQKDAQGETVFAADPQGAVGEQLMPVAEDIAGFIGLLISCKDAALIAGAHQWSSFRFREQAAAIVPGMKASSVLRALQNIYHPPVISDPAGYMLGLRKERMSTTEAAPWSVGFDADFAQPCVKGGKEVPVNRSLDAEGGTWNVPSFYLCEEGIVVDTYLEVSADSLAAFQKEWSDRSESSLSIGDRLQRYLDDPLTASVTGILTVNDKPLRCKNSFTAIWDPLGDNDAPVRQFLNHYKLDPDCGYLLRRYCFLRKGKHPQIRSMQLTLEGVPVMVPEESFTAQEAGMRFRFNHPSTGLEHIFTVLSVNKEALNPNFLTNHPCFYTRLTYTLEPSISPENFRIVDQKPSDFWEDYQDDPAAVIYADKKPDPGRYALSSLHYEPQDLVRWRMIFRRKIYKDLQLQLLP
jgi:hypothetical protein